MVEPKTKTAKVQGDTVVVNVEFAPRTAKVRRQRFYTHSALELAKEAFPKLKIGKLISEAVTVNNENNLKGEWVFQLVKEETNKPVAPEVLVDARQEPAHKDKGVLKDVAEPPKKTKKKTRKTLKSVKEESKEVTGD